MEEKTQEEIDELSRKAKEGIDEKNESDRITADELRVINEEKIAYEDAIEKEALQEALDAQEEYAQQQEEEYAQQQGRMHNN